MKLSVIVVSHNQCKLLRQCLTSLIKAAKGIEHEVFVVDDASTDVTLHMVKNQFPAVKVLANEHRSGITASQNEALRLCRGEYILLVGADTICNSDSLNKLLTFMDIHEQAGGVSPRMVDAEGEFITESKYGINKEWAAFLKLTNLCKLFPGSKAFNRLRYDWVTEFENSEMIALNEACMLIRRSVLNKIGLFDERFVMFGQNIDLSLRIHKEGFKNYYYAHTFLINHQQHKLAKFSLAYLKYFYGAMLIFALKNMFKLPVVQLKPMGGLITTSYEVER